MKAEVEQVGGDHYKADYQHWDWAAETGLPYLEACATKYVSRWRQKNGAEDLHKAMSYLEKARAVANKTGFIGGLAGYRRGLDHELRSQFLDSAGVQEADANIICYIDLITEESDIDFAIGLIKELLTGPLDQPFGYPGDG